MIMKQLKIVRMKSIYLNLTSAFFIIFAGLAISGCGEDNDEAAAQGLSIKVYSPVKVVEGIEVVITGTGLNDVTAVIFPGNISVTSINRVSNNMITVITPVGISAAGGELTLQAGNESVTSPELMTVANPTINTIVPGDEAAEGREIVISGTDMEFYDKMIFPGKKGDIVINAVHFERKSALLIRVKVPEGIVDGPARIRIVSISGKEDLLPEIYLIGKPDVFFSQDYLLLCGEEGKSWTWDDSKPKVWGNGSYLSSTAPAWWTLSIEELRNQTQTEGGGAEMTFTFEGLKLTMLRSDGTTAKGSFLLDMTKTIGTWSIGELKTNDVSVLNGVSPDEGRKRIYDYKILVLDEDKLVLSYPEEGVVSQGGAAWFWMFKAIE